MARTEKQKASLEQRRQQQTARIQGDQPPQPPVPVDVLLNVALKRICDDNQGRYQSTHQQITAIEQAVKNKQGDAPFNPTVLPGVNSPHEVGASPFLTEPDGIRVFGEGGCFRKVLAATTQRWYYAYNKINSDNQDARYKAQVNLLFLVEGANPLFYRKCLEDQDPHSRHAAGTVAFSPKQFMDNAHPVLTGFFAVNRFPLMDTPQDSGRVDAVVNSAQKKYKPPNKPRNPLLDTLEHISRLDPQLLGDDLRDSNNIALPMLNFAAPLVFQIYLSFLGRDCVHQSRLITQQKTRTMDLLCKPPSVIKTALAETALGWLEFMLRSLHIQHQKNLGAEITEGLHKVDPEHEGQPPSLEINPFDPINGDFKYFLDLGIDFEGLMKHEALEWNIHQVLPIFEQADFSVFDFTPLHATNPQHMLEHYRMLIRMVRHLSHALEKLPELLTQLTPHLSSPLVQLGQQVLRNVSNERKDLS